MNFIQIKDNFIILKVKIKANQSLTKITLVDLDFIYLSVNAVPDKEKANKEIIKYFENLFNVEKNNITIEIGKHIPKKKEIKIIGSYNYNCIINILKSNVEKLDF